jgi:hypothetical protein
MAIDGQKRFYTVVDEIVREQEVREKDTAKLIYFQKFHWEDGAPPEYRLTYYMLGLKPGRMQGRWVFGQYSLMIPVELFASLIEEARRRGWEGV